MLSFSSGAWDLYFCYDSDFMREIKDLYTHGLSGGTTLQVTPHGQMPGGSDCYSDFQYGPDGSYVNFVRAAAIVFLTVGAISDSFDLPAWLVEDLSGIPGSYVHRGTKLERCIDSLRRSSIAAKQNRTFYLKKPGFPLGVRRCRHPPFRKEFLYAPASI